MKNQTLLYCKRKIRHLQFVISLMSSHHFVKEGQEPALIIVDPVSVTTVGPLLEWAPLVIVLDQAVEQVISWGIKTDIVITEAAKVEAKTKELSDQMPITILSHQLFEDSLHTAFNHLINEAQFVVNVVVHDPEAYLKKAEQFADRLEIILMNESVKWVSVSHGHLTKWIPANSRLFFRETTGAINISGDARVSGNELIANNDGLVSLTSESLFWVGEAL
jgi:hypothetical protein